MKLSALKEILPKLTALSFQLENGVRIPAHFHITEIGRITKDFIDCGGIIRNEKIVNFQLWDAQDYDHLLKPDKLMKIINLSEDKLGIENLDIEVEYQQNTIGKYGLRFENNVFILTPKKTDCLASDSCGIPKEKLHQTKEVNSCNPGGGCC